MENAEAAANIPIPVVFKAPIKGFCPVNLLLKYPKSRRQRIVNMEESLNPV